MNNEPVAWIKKDTLIYVSNYNYASITIQVQKNNSVGFDIPLYTTPQIKELSDEEIYKIYLEIEDTKCPSDDFEYMMFAKAILKKASEK